jgi:hypothetical protein
MIKKFLYLLIGVVMINSCKCSNKSNKGEFGKTDTVTADSALPLAPQAVEDLVQNISSPVEMAALIKSIGAPFAQKYMAPTNTDNFNTSFSKALNLGIYGADLGYLNMYNKTSSVIQYITAIKTLADGISVGQFFDFSTLKRLATNNENIDSLMYISIHSFNVMDNYLRKNKRSNLSALMIAGVYVEGLYITTQVAKERPNRKLAEDIGEQKNIFEQLLLILKNYRADPYFASLIKDMESIQKELEAVKITIEPGKPISIEKDGMLTIKQTSKSIINISDDALKRIISQTEIVRNKIIK